MVPPNRALPPPPPTVLVCAGLDPTGGAGLQADIQVCSAFGVHSLPCMTINTVQTTQKVFRFDSADVRLLQQQLDALAMDCTLSAIKIGAGGSVRILEVLAGFMRTSWIPIVIDPVFCGGGGGFLSDEDYASFLMSELVPLATLITPNREELIRMTGVDTQSEALAAIFRAGAKNVLLTGGDSPEPPGQDQVINHLYRASPDHSIQRVQTWSSPRLAGQFHGTGCTLSTAIACLMAQGHPLVEAIEQAERWVQTTLIHAYPIGQGQWIPNRFRVPLALKREIS